MGIRISFDHQFYQLAKASRLSDSVQTRIEDSLDLNTRSWRLTV